MEQRPKKCSKNKIRPEPKNYPSTRCDKCLKGKMGSGNQHVPESRWDQSILIFQGLNWTEKIPKMFQEVVME